MGDEYFANLDHIESVENFKEGYESEAHCSDSEGSGVDMSRVKLPASSKHGKPNTKEERNSSTTGKSKGPELQGYCSKLNAEIHHMTFKI